MGADIKSLRTRIKSVDSTLHLTKAMELVASSKLRRSGEAMRNAREYAAALDSAMSALTSGSECKKSVYMRASGDRTRLIVIAGDRGLAGGYNANVFRFMRDYPDAEVIPIGKRACDRYGKEAVSAERFSAEEAVAMANELCADFGSGKFDSLGIVCTKYISLLVREVEVKWILPFTAEKHVEASGMIFEPDELTVLNALASEYVAGKIMAAVRESFACEIASRKTAMDSAGKNAQEMIDALQLEYNRARQSAITQEITEIVAGSGE